MELTGLTHLFEILKQHPKIQLSAANGGAFAQLMASRFVSTDFKKNVVVVLPDTAKATAWLAHFEAMAGSATVGINLSLLKSVSPWGRDRFVRNEVTSFQRMQALSSIFDEKTFVIITTWSALAQKTLNKSELESCRVRVSVGQEFNQDDFMNSMINIGYRRSSMVDEEGSVAVRGGVIDIFPSHTSLPVRIEFIGDEVGSIRPFDPESQRSFEEISGITLLPCREFLTPPDSRAEHTQSLYELLLNIEMPQAQRQGLVESFRQSATFQGVEMFAPNFRTNDATMLQHLWGKDDVVWVFPDSMQSCVKEWEDFRKDVSSAYEVDSKSGFPTVSPELHFDWRAPDCTELSHYVELNEPTDRQGAVRTRVTSSSEWSTFLGERSLRQGLFEQVVSAIEHCNGVYSGKVLVLGQSQDNLGRLQELLQHRGIKAKQIKDGLLRLHRRELSENLVTLSVGELPDYVWLVDDETLIVPDAMFFGVQHRPAKKGSRKLKNIINSMRDLVSGNLVVHSQHGIGLYRGMVTLEVGGTVGEFIHLEYQGGDKLYLPVDKLSLLQKYSNSDGSTGVVDRLRSASWEKRKSTVKKAVKDMAEKLLQIQAQRVLRGGKAYAAVGDEYHKFESEVPYDETEDQIRAIDDVQEDLSKPEPMDRLICGDVGFGKTEVALRASVRVILDHRQVIVLVPTTVLCYQHYRTFHGRLSHHGFNVAQINRFIKPVEVKKTLEAFARGGVDVLIGTHRALSTDVKARNLGLLVVDEEQKFGVAHKERIKEMRANCDILTLTATPIPRTLHMAMLGLRNISIIATPPIDRRFVKTFVMQRDEAVIKRAIMEEIDRGGQVFYVHNRVEDIERVREHIRNLVPTARVRVGHGQMPETDLEQVIIDFIEHRFDVLVCTTIIESGIDMPNVNTLIVDEADHFGLSQLYQLRGRVGRSGRQAYAYLMLRQEKLTDEARMRLDALVRHQDLGSGFQIASHDLEIRGAGNLLGSEQSGRIAEVGLEMYTDMLESAINELRTGKSPLVRDDVELKLPFSAAIPKSYIADERERLQFYKWIFTAETSQELDGIRANVRDQFGAFPGPVELIFCIAELKLLLKSMGAASFAWRGTGPAEVRFGALKENAIMGMIEIIRKGGRKFSLTPDYRLLIFVDDKTISDQDSMLSFSKEVMALLFPIAAKMSEV
jgi:transcription-repair coupling factor (superfamily II helicase)